MNAIVLYPAAFRAAATEASFRDTSAMVTTPQTSADVIALPQASSPVANVRMIRLGASQTAQCLTDIDTHLQALREREDRMRARSQDIRSASQDIGVQMQRLIEETRRMVSYLRTESMV